MELSPVCVPPQPSLKSLSTPPPKSAVLQEESPTLLAMVAFATLPAAFTKFKIHLDLYTAFLSVPLILPKAMENAFAPLDISPLLLKHRVEALQ